jgi:hypothetical protein
MAQPTTAETLRAKLPLGGVDPDIKVPQAVRDAGARSEAIQRALIGDAEPSVLEPPPNGETPPPAPPPGVQPEPPAEPPQQLQPPPPEETVPPEEWERRFRAMKGRYDRLTETTSGMSEQLQRLQNENAILRQPAAPPPGAAPNAPLLTEQEVADYGPEFIDVVRRAASEVAAPLQAEIAHLRSQLGTVQQETGNAFLTRMHATIGGLVPDWEQINRDQRFMDWVKLPDMFSGAIRQQLMQEAWNNGDAVRVAAFFRAFLAEAAAVDPQRGTHAQPPPPSMVPAREPGAPGIVPLATRLSLDQLAAPGRAHSGTQQPTSKPVYTAQDISRFYTECAAGKWRTREADRAAIDADIIAAQHEGRIISDQRTVRPTERNGHW